MIRPINACSPGCPGWRLAFVCRVPVAIRCPACWFGAALAPGPAYYQRQPECKAAVCAAWEGIKL